MSKHMIQHIRTDNDRNGNPRRLYLVVAEDGSVVAYNEGYYGHQAVPAAYRRDAVPLPSIDVTPSEYRRLLKTFPPAKGGSA